MTLLFMDSMQDALLIPNPEYTSGLWAGVVTGRDGQANGAVNINAGITALDRRLTFPSSAAVCFVGCAVNQAQVPDSHYLMKFFDSAGTVQLVLNVNASGFIEVRRTSNVGTLLGTSSGHTPIGANEWHYFEAKVSLHTSTGVVTVKLDGVTVIGPLTAQVTSSLISNVFGMSWSNPNAGGNTQTFYDDLYVCDAVDATATQGVPNDTHLGDCRVQALFPSSAGDSTGWTPSTGSNFQTVDESPPNTTDYNSAVATSSGTRDLYNVGNLTGTVTAVVAVRIHLYAAKSDSGPALIKPTIKENATVTSDPSQGLAITFAGIHGVMKAVKPSGGVWSSTDVDNLQVGAEVG